MRNFLLLLFLANSFILFGQITKKNWLVGGTGNFSSRNNSYTNSSISYNSKYSDLTISPTVGYFIVDKFAVGLKPSFNWSKAIAYPPGGGNSNDKRFMIGPFARYYILSPEKPVNFLIESAFQKGILRRSGPSKGTNNNLSLMAGPVVYFNSSVGIEVLAGYASSREEEENFAKVTNKGLLISIGFQIHLEK